MITDKDVREYFENNPKSKGVGIFMIDLAECDRYVDFGVDSVEYGINCIEPEEVILNEEKVVG